MAPQATTASSTRLYSPLAEHQRHVRPRRKSRHRSPYGQRARQRAGTTDDATAAIRDLLGRPQAHTTLRAHRQHAGLELWWRRHGVAQGDGSNDDAGKQLPVRVRVTHLVPRHRVPTRTLAHASFPGSLALPRAPTSPFRCCCCRCRRRRRQRGTAKVPLARPSPRAPTRSVVEDAFPLLSVPLARLWPYSDTDVS